MISHDDALTIDGDEEELDVEEPDESDSESESDSSESLSELLEDEDEDMDTASIGLLSDLAFTGGDVSNSLVFFDSGIGS